MNPITRYLAHLLSCRDVTQLVSQTQDRPATPIERFKLRMHLSVCTACANFDRQMTLVREAMRRYRDR